MRTDRQPYVRMLANMAIAIGLVAAAGVAAGQPAAKPNIIIIYADDLGYGDLGCYGATALATPNIDKLAAGGLRFADAYATSATCTPSRYGLLTGRYPWRVPGTRILAGDAPLIIEPGTPTLPALLRTAGYTTAVVGKWHLGLGTAGKPLDWNGPITPGPGAVGFDESLIMAATGDRVPTVLIDQERVALLDPADPLEVDYTKNFPGEPTGASHPQRLSIQPANKQHSGSINDGISRIGFMRGGQKARWHDAELGDLFTQRALQFIETHHDKPFFLFFALHEPHVPRVPAPRFAGSTALGPRGDVIAQLDAHVGAVRAALERHGLLERTLIVLSSDNGPVLNDGYQDQAAERNGAHRPAGPFSGGKYSLMEGGTRVPLVVSWPGRVRPGATSALVSQVDFLATLAALAGVPVPPGAAPDSQNLLPAMLGETPASTRTSLVVEAGGELALRSGQWKLIPAGNTTTTRRGQTAAAQLYQLSADPAETNNLAATEPAKLHELQAELTALRQPPAKPAPPIQR